MVGDDFVERDFDYGRYQVHTTLLGANHWKLVQCVVLFFL